MEYITILNDPTANGKVAIVIDGAEHSTHGSFCDAAKHLVSVVDEPAPTHPIVLKGNDGTVLETLYADTVLMIEWARFSADSGDYYGSSVGELCDLAEYCRWRFDDTLNSDYTPGATSPSRPDPNEWYMFNTVNEVSKADIEAYTAALTKVYEACKKHGLDY